jgi:hypothetical protein
MDTTENLTVKVLTDNTRLRVLDKNMLETVVICSGEDGNYKTFRLPALPPWSMVMGITE